MFIVKLILERHWKVRAQVKASSQESVSSRAFCPLKDFAFIFGFTSETQYYKNMDNILLHAYRTIKEIAGIY